ncbi:cyclophilin-like domain-containing protein [Russula vinacea]|nr:cyclophilin-like domain-containing protein [Russula vinacea]
MPNRNPDVFFDISIDGQEAGRIIFRLYDDRTPLTARNFRELATGQHGLDTPVLAFIELSQTYFMIQGGDITTGDGSGGQSIFGGHFRDESFALKHDKPGLISMANRGPGTNSSQYFITTAAAPWCDGKNVVFGEVYQGLDLVRQIQSYASQDILRRPSVKIVVERSGVL